MVIFQESLAVWWRKHANDFSFKLQRLKKIYETIVEKLLRLSLKNQQVFPRRQSEKAQEIAWTAIQR